MNEYAHSVKGILENILDEITQNSRDFVNDPNTDFIRKRKLDFKEMLNILLSMGGNSLKLELMKYFSFDEETVTCSGFVQQRAKILPKALETLFHKFTSAAIHANYHEGYRLLAADGSTLCSVQNPKDEDYFVRSNENAKGYNLFHLNALYDLCSRTYVDALIQPIRKRNEYTAITDMVDRSDIQEPTILMADRGFESYNVFEHIKKKGWKYVIRVKDSRFKGIISGISLPDQEEFDIEYATILTRENTKEVKAHPEKYRFIPPCGKFDYLPPYTKGFYPISFRIVRFAISENSYEVIITNLDKKEFPAEKIKELYHMRWGIETSFRELKYAIGLKNFHSKKATFVLQEIFARLTMYNFCEIITTHVIIQQKNRKQAYQVNFTLAIAICLQYFRCRDELSSPNLEALIQKNILPIRKGRNDPRKVKPKSSACFIYRVA